MVNDKKITVDIATLIDNSNKKIDTTNDIFTNEKSIKSTITKETKTKDEVRITSLCVVDDFITTETQKTVSEIKNEVVKHLVKNSVIGLVRKANRNKLLSQYENFEI